MLYEERGFKIDYEPLTPALAFKLNIKQVIPFQLIVPIEDQGRIDSWKDLNTSLQTQEEKEYDEEKNRELYKTLAGLIKSVNGKAIDTAEMTIEELIVYGSFIIQQSTKLIKERTYVNKSSMILLDIMAKRYGKAPTEILGESGMNDMDKWNINFVCLSAGIEEENRQQAKANNKLS